jgi:uncharacterized protein with ParB-like and HNH nuclease domain
MAASITRTLFTIADFLGWQRDGTLNLSPSFQRRPVWKPQAKSYLIDTIVRDLPTPIIFLRQITDTKTLKTVREVVDGQQRIRTLLSYIDKKALPDWNESRDSFTVSRQHNKEIAGKSFAQLDDRLKKMILGYEFSTHVLPNDTSDQQVLDIFRRMNATGTKLNKQELRNAEFFGEFIQAVYETSLKFLDIWRKWKVFSEDNIARMDEVEFVSELYILILNGITEKTPAAIDKYYRENDIHFPNSGYVEARLIEIMSDIDAAFGDEIGNSPLSNRIILYGLVAALYDIIYGFGSDLSNRANKRALVPLDRSLPAIVADLTNREALPDAVQEALLSRSGRKSNREALTTFLKARLAA